MKKIIYPSLLLMSLMLFSSSKNSFFTPTLEELREELLLSNTCTWYESEERDGKQEVIFERTNQKTGEQYKNYPYNQCTGGSTVALRYLFATGTITEIETWYDPKTYFKNNGFNQKFKDIFGVNPIAKIIPDANKSKEKGLRFFDNKALETIFNKLYAKPTTKIKGTEVTYQKIYDISLKEYVADMANTMALILKDKKQFEKMAKDYLNRLQKEKDFNGITVTNEYRETYFPEMEFKCKNYSATNAVNRLLGIMLRRQIDGTLPIVLNTIKTALKDYDKATFEKHKNSF